MSDDLKPQLPRRTFLQLAAATALPVDVHAAPKEHMPDHPVSRPATGPSLPTEFAYGYDHEPYPLDAGPHLFLDWRYVSAGQEGYLTPDGRNAREVADEIAGKVEPGAIRAEPTEAPHGIRLEAQPAEKIGPVLKLDKPWEFRIDPYTSLHRVDGKYRYWYEVEDTSGTDSRILCYAESDDGLKWTKPELGLVDWQSNRKNNIVYGGPLTLKHGFHGSTVFPDPSAPAEQRWKMMYMGRFSEEEMTAFQREHPNQINPIAMKKRRMLLGAVSPDGLKWTPIDEPLVAHFNDSQPSIYYDAVLQRYVGYFRTLFADRRAIGRAETTDFRRWPVPQAILWSDPGQSASEDYYTQGRSLYPGTRTGHIMLPSIYDRRLDSLYSRMATSLDGRTWSWMPGGPIVYPGPDGTWDGGAIFMGSGLTDIAGDRVGAPFTAYHVPHKFPRMIRQGEIGLATWKKERLVALVADEEGEFHTPVFAVKGKQLHLNFQTPRAGWVRVEVVGDKTRTLANCDRLYGDQMKAPVSWKGDSSLGAGELRLRFHLRAAKLFSFEVRDA